MIQLKVKCPKRRVTTAHPELAFLRRQANKISKNVLTDNSENTPVKPEKFDISTGVYIRHNRVFTEKFPYLMFCSNCETVSELKGHCTTL